MDDRSLLDEFVAHRSETAFRTITDQYLNLVYSTALRETNDPQMAQDVTQAVFILLARKAESLPQKVLLAGWLYRTTHFVANRAMRSELRRQRREQEAFQMQQNEFGADTWKNVAPLLDEALSGLRETDRDAIVLHFFQNEPVQKVGEALGVSQQAAAKRISRALDKLRGFFGRRGFLMSSLILGATLTKYSTQAAPALLGQSVVTSVFMQAPATAAAHYALVHETLKAWQWTKTKWLVGLGFASAVAVLLIAHSVSAMRSGSQSPLPIKAQTTDGISANNGISGNDPMVSSTTATTAVAPAGPVFNFQAVDGVTGKGLAGVKVLAFTAQDPQHVDIKTNLVTDAQGRCDIPLTYSNSLAVVAGVIAEGYEQRCVFAGGNEPVPAGWVLKMYPGSTIGGVVQDESGRPVANADILVQFFGTGDAEAREFQRERPGFPSEEIAVATTDASGRWQFRSAPETNGDFYVVVRHPEFPTATFHTDANKYAIQTGIIGLVSFHAQNAVLVLKSGPGVSGVVTDEQQNPVVGAKVQFGEDFDQKGPAAVTDDKGAFTLNSLKIGIGHITVTAKSFAPERLAVDVKSDSKPVAIRLKPGALLRVRVVDENGNGMPGVDVRLQGWRGNNTLEWGGMTDADGRIAWDSAPTDQLDMFAGKQGYFYSRMNMITADGEEHVIKLRKELVVSGWALDAATGQAITEFKAIPGTDRHDLAHGSNGQYSVTFNEPQLPLQVTIEAEGYEPLTSEPLPLNTNQVVWNAELKRPDPSQAIAGTILFPDGTPAAGAQVALCTVGHGQVIGRGKFINFGDSGIKKADENGQFSYAPDKSASRVVAIDPRGFATLDLNRAARPFVIQLQGWGRIEGSLKLRNGSNAGRDIVLLNIHYGAPTAPHVSYDLQSFSVKTDENGNFVIEQAPPGAANLCLSPGVGVPMDHQTPVVVPQGGTVQTQIGGSGVTVRGRFVLSDPQRAINWPKLVWTANVYTKFPPPAAPQNLGREQRAQWERDFYSSDAGLARARNFRSFSLNVAEDGSFSAEDVLPGNYELNASFNKEPVDHTAFVPLGPPPMGTAREEFVVPDQSQNAKEVDLGTVTVKLR